MNRFSKTLFQLIFGALLISTAAVWVKLADVAPTLSGFYRMFFGGSLLIVFSLLSKDKLWVNLKYFGLLFFIGFLFAIDLYLWHRSIHYIGPGLATVLANFQAFIMASVGFIVFKEVFRWSFFWGLIFSFIGLFLLVGIEWSNFSIEYKKGIFLGLATALAYSCFLLTLKYAESLPEKLSTSANLSIISLSSALILAIVLVWENQSFYIPNTKSLFSLLALGVFPQVIAWFLISKAIPRLPASVTGVVLLLQPALSMLWDILFFARNMVFFEIFGLMLVLVGVFWSNKK